MRTVLKFALAVCVAQMSFAQAPAREISDNLQSLLAVPQVRPSLSVNVNPKLCAPYLKAWTAVYDGGQTLMEDSIDPARIFPQAEAFRFPEAYNKSIYDDHNPLRIDFDKSGDDEVLYVKTNERGWREFGMDLLLFPDEAAWQASLDYEGYPRFEDREGRSIPGLSYENLASYEWASVVHIFRIGAEIYTVSSTQQPNEAQGSSSDLVHLNAAGGPRTVCSVALLPATSSFASWRDNEPFYAAARRVYGGTEGCGNLIVNFNPQPPDASLPLIIYRPWAISSVMDGHSRKRVFFQPSRTDDQLELNLLTWALSDPGTWQSYLQLKALRPQFISRLRIYYLAKFTRSTADADRYAEQAYRLLLNTMMYRWSGSDNFLAVRHDALDIGSDSSPREIFKAIAKWDSAHGGGGKLSLLSAATYLRLPWSEIEEAMGGEEGLRQVLEARDGNAVFGLIAAVGNASLVRRFLDYGADPDANVTWFGKTPLMYAAQQGDLASVRLMIGAGADVNMRTDGSERAKYCYRLDRDHRTSLMYAAENASPEVIDAILKAGADISAKDTKGNTALWYFGRNVKITDPAERARISKRLGG